MLSMLCNVEVDLGSCVCWEYGITILHNQWTSVSWSQWRSRNYTKWDRPLLHRQLFSIFEFKLLKNGPEMLTRVSHCNLLSAKKHKGNLIRFHKSCSSKFSRMWSDLLKSKTRCPSLLIILWNINEWKFPKMWKWSQETPTQNSTKKWAVWRMNN